MNIDEFKELINKPIVLRVNKRHLSIFLRQFSVLLSSGINPNNAIYILKDQKEIKSLNYSLNEIYDDLNKGDHISLAFSKHKIYDDFLISMMETGEESGELGSISSKLSDYYEKEDDVSKKIKGALTYPVILFLTTIVVLIFVLKYVMPTFVSLFENSNMVMPLITRVLIGISKFIGEYFFILVTLLLVVIILFIVLKKKYFLKIKIDYIKVKMPFIGTNYIKITTGRISRALAISYSSGVNFMDSLRIIGKGTNNLYVEEKIDEAILEIEEGISISEAFANTGILPQLFNSMVEVGEETGKLGEILDIISDYYKKESDYSINSIIRIFEPLMIIFMAIFVGMIVISIAIPMFDIINNYNY